jgi:hypothetical protein
MMLLIWLSPPAVAQNNNNAAQAAPVRSPATPRMSDGKPLFGPLAGGKGLWGYPFGAELSGDDGERQVMVLENPAVPGETMTKPSLSEIPFQPWARALYDYREQSRLEPYTRCKPSAGARMPGTAYGTQVVHFPELRQLIIFQTGGSHSYRTIFMDGRPHPANLTPSYYGHAVGRWEGDTLVVDSVGFNERMWIENIGMPHTDKLHLVERITRVSQDWIRWEFHINDPGAYTAPWKSGYYMRLNPASESFEFVCQDNNQAHELMVGVETSVDRDVIFIP